MSARQMKKLIPIFSEGAIDADLVQEGQQNLTDYFQKKGFFHASVTSDLQRQPDHIVLVYKIDRGIKYKVDRISFVGTTGSTQGSFAPGPDQTLSSVDTWQHQPEIF